MTRKSATTVSFVVLTVVGVALAVELGAYLLLRWASGEIVSHGTLGAARRRVAQGMGDIRVPRGTMRWGDLRIREIPALHPYIGYVADPSNSALALDEGSNRESADFGFPRNRWSLFQKPSSDRVVVGVFGGSLADRAAAKSGILARELSDIDRFAGREVIVLSLAYGGYKQPQQLMALAYLLSLGAHFDVVVNLDGFNEVALPAVANVPNEVFPFYPRGWVLQVANLDQEVRRTVGLLTYLREERSRSARRSATGLSRHSMTAGLLWYLRDRRLGSRVSDLEMALEMGARPDREYQAHGPVRRYESEKDMYLDLASVWERSSVEMHALCDGMGIEYFHFLQPNQYVPDSKPLTPEERRRAWDGDHPYRPSVEKGYPLLIDRGADLRRQGVEFVDLTGIFSDTDTTLYDDTCCHLNREGNVLLARAMARAVDGTPER